MRVAVCSRLRMTLIKFYTVAFLLLADNLDLIRSSPLVLGTTRTALLSHDPWVMPCTD
jgi:hypothetical protein